MRSSAKQYWTNSSRHLLDTDFPLHGSTNPDTVLFSSPHMVEALATKIGNRWPYAMNTTTRGHGLRIHKHADIEGDGKDTPV
mmetsp:Transcript_20061/g.27554  ORF Transcript_20061/g.27554 Transcript_20061/m.27554 type:complete len:82 (+) Transcript_20061:1205-1450(+)